MDDAISRILKRMWNCRGKHTTSIDKVAMEQIIHDELSVTQKSGKWITEEISGGRKVYCSECKESAVFEYVRDGDIYSSYGHGVVKKTQYCPNCGAKMESEDNDAKC